MSDSSACPACGCTLEPNATMCPRCAHKMQHQEADITRHSQNRPPQGWKTGILKLPRWWSTISFGTGVVFILGFVDDILTLGDDFSWWRLMPLPGKMLFASFYLYCAYVLWARRSDDQNNR